MLELCLRIGRRVRFAVRYTVTVGQRRTAAVDDRFTREVCEAVVLLLKNRCNLSIEFQPSRVIVVRIVHLAGFSGAVIWRVEKSALHTLPPSFDLAPSPRLLLHFGLELQHATAAIAGTTVGGIIAR